MNRKEDLFFGPILAMVGDNRVHRLREFAALSSHHLCQSDLVPRSDQSKHFIVNLNRSVTAGMTAKNAKATMKVRKELRSSIALD